MGVATIGQAWRSKSGATTYTIDAIDTLDGVPYVRFRDSLHPKRWTWQRWDCFELHASLHWVPVDRRAA